MFYFIFTVGELSEYLSLQPSETCMEKEMFWQDLSEENLQVWSKSSGIITNVNTVKWWGHLTEMQEHSALILNVLTYVITYQGVLEGICSDRSK
jgi:hypothetical protein